MNAWMNGWMDGWMDGWIMAGTLPSLQNGSEASSPLSCLIALKKSICTKELIRCIKITH